MAEGQDAERVLVEGVAATYVESRLVALGVLPAAGSNMEATLRLQGAWAASSGTVSTARSSSLARRTSRWRRSRASTAWRRISCVRRGRRRGGARRPGTEEPALDAARRRLDALSGRLGSTLAVAAHALEAHGRLDAARQKALARRLLDRFDGRRFGSTFETSQVLVHSAWLSRRSSRARALPKVRVRAGGTELPASALTARETPGGVEIAVDPREAAKGPLVVDGGGEDAVLRARIVRAVPFDRAPAVPGAWDLKREYFRLNPKTGARTALEATVAVGDLVYVRLTFRPRAGTRPWWASSYYVLTDQVPAGLAVVEEDRLYDAAPFALDLHGAGCTTRDLRTDRVTYTFSFARVHGPRRPDGLRSPRAIRGRLLGGSRAPGGFLR